MGRSSRCLGRSLYNHLKQRNIEVNIDYTFHNTSHTWSGTMTVFGNSYATSNCLNKASVVEGLMEQANTHIQEQLSSSTSK
jgi:hypothetical protein